MKLTATEIRDWLESAATWTGLYLTWRWRPRREHRDVTSTPATLNLHPAHGTSSTSLALTTGNDAGTQAVIDSMAELFPYEFPPN